MTIIKKVIYVAVIVVALFFISCAVFIRFQGKALIESRAAVIFKQPVTIDDVGYVFPFGVQLTDLNVPGLLFAPEAEVHLNLLSLWGRDVHLEAVRLVDPVLTLHRGLDNQILWTGHTEIDVPQQSAVASPRRDKVHGTKTVVRVLDVSNAKIYFPGHDRDEPFDIVLQDVGVNAKNVSLSGGDTDVIFELAGKLTSDGVGLSGDIIKGSGTLNWPKRNMDAVFALMGPQGSADLELHLTSRNNDMTVKGRLKTPRIFASQAEENTSIQGALLNAVNSSGMGLDMEFSFPTKMDRWELRNIEFSGNLGPSIDSGKK